MENRQYKHDIPFDDCVYEEHCQIPDKNKKSTYKEVICATLVTSNKAIRKDNRKQRHDNRFWNEHSGH